MPIYEYQCQNCGRHFEKRQSVTEEPLLECEKCGGKLEKQWSLSGFQFKGEGWYITDYARKGSVSEKVEKELSTPESGSSGDDKKAKKTPAKKADKS